MNVKGQGIYYAVEIKEDKIVQGPILPYDKNCLTPFEVKNLMDFPIEFYSTEFDKQYLEEEEILKWYELLVNQEVNPE
mgnify:CR=1 FL=1